MTKVMETITFLSVEINLNCGVSTRVKNLTSMDLQDRHVAGSGEGRGGGGGRREISKKLEK